MLEELIPRHALISWEVYQTLHILRTEYEAKSCPEQTKDSERNITASDLAGIKQVNSQRN